MDQHGEYQDLMDSLPGNARLEAGDTFSTVRAWRLGSHLVKYEVLQRPPELWGVVIASQSSFEEAYRVQLKAVSAGFEDAAVIESARYPRLRPGYYVTVAAFFEDQASGRPCLGRARTRWSDAYARRIR
ncbi:MAG: hypothetical protein AB1758_01015 [Candidatus Eremiobacterota bacterium]